MSKLFDIRAGKVVIDADTLAIPPFKQFWESFEDKGLAEKEITFCVFKNNWDSPYKAFDVDERWLRVLTDVFGDQSYVFSSNYDEFEKRYIEFMNTPSTRLLDGAEDGVEFLIKEYKELRNKQGKTDDYGKPLVTAEQVGKWLSQLGPAIKSLSMLRDQVRTEEKLGLKAKGGNEINYFELPRNTK